MRRSLIDLSRKLVSISALALVASLFLPATSRADVERIREKCLELEQKLNKNRVEVQIRGEKANSDRIYKDFAFLLSEGKVNEAAEAKNDPQAERLRLYLIQINVASQLAPYSDELQEFLRTSTVDLDGEKVTYKSLLRRLAQSADGGDRRKLASVLGDLVETSAVFRNEIVKRTNDTYATWGFEHYADFVSQRDHIDFEALSAQAESFLEESQPLYDTLFAKMSQELLGEEARKVRFYDLPYLVSGCKFAAALPSDSITRRLRGIYKGLGVDLGTQSGLSMDMEHRPGKSLSPICIPVMVPNDVEVAIDPIACGRDDSQLVRAVGEAQIFTQSTQTGFENAYLANPAAQAALAWIPRFVLNEPKWIEKNVAGGDVDRGLYQSHRAFASLFEARMLAAMTLFEIKVFSHKSTDMDKDFNDVMRIATGVRVSTADSHRSTEFLTPLESAERFQGLLLATGIKKHLADEFGADWYNDGKAGAVLSGLWKQGGALTPDAIAAAVSAEPAPALYLEGITSLTQSE